MNDENKRNAVETAIALRIEEIMSFLQIPKTDSNKDTPKRIAKMWNREIFANRNDSTISDLRENITTFPNVYEKTEMVIVKDIPFSSTCEHHWLPFTGKATVGYVPNRLILGLSKIPRIVKFFSKKPQLQEQFTTEIGDFIRDEIKPWAVFVEVEAEHQCVSCRGAESECSTKTYYKWIHETCDKKIYKEFRNRVKE